MNSLTMYQELDVMNLGNILSKSGYFQDTRDAAQAVVKVLAGQELGFGPIASMTGINVIKGRVTLSANLMAAAIKRSGRYTFRLAKGHPTETECTIEFLERNGDKWESLGHSSFTMADAKQAGLGGDNWRKYPRNMLFARALSNGAKWYCPDVFGGPVYTPDEMGADVDGETGEVIAVEMPPQPEPEPAPQIEPPPAKPKNGNGHKLNPGQQKFWDNVQEVTQNYYDNPSHLINVIGKWPNFSSQDDIESALSVAVDHANEQAQVAEAA